MNPEKRWFRSVWLDWHQRRPRLRPFFLLEKLGQLLDSCRSEKSGHREILAECDPNLRNYLRGKERMAAEIKEIVIDPDHCKPEDLRPDLCQLLFQRRPRCDRVPRVCTWRLVRPCEAQRLG